jgi:hypothetical protein
MDQESKTIRVYITEEEPELPSGDATNYKQTFVTVDIDNKPQRIKVTSPDMSAISWGYENNAGTPQVS